MSISRIPDMSQIIPGKFKMKDVKYKAYERLKIKVPMRACFIGKTGSCKTNALVNLIFEMGCFNRIYLFVKDPEEMYYAWLIDEYKKLEKRCHLEGQLIFYSNDLDQLPTYDQFDIKYNNLVVLDDLINESPKQLNKCAALWTMGRKRNISSVFLSQQYYAIPKRIRDNTDYFFILQVVSIPDLHRILGEHNLGTEKETLDKMYRISTADVGQFLLVDLRGPEPLRYRFNFTPFILGNNGSGGKNEIKEDDED